MGVSFAELEPSIVTLNNVIRAALVLYLYHLYPRELLTD